MAATAAAGQQGYNAHAGAQLLPADILRRCMECLSHRDLLAASEVSREWYQIARSDSLWKPRYKADFDRSGDIRCSRSGSSSLGCPAAQLFGHESEASPEQGAAWWELYKDRSALESNWQRGRCGWSYLEGHRDYIRCAQLQGSRLATCSGSYMQRDCSIRVWDVDTGRCLEHMRGHEGPIWCMHYEGRRVASCDDEGGVRLWDLDSHRVGVASSLEPLSLKCVSQDGGQLAVAGETGMLALWSLAAIQQALEEAEQPTEEEAMEDAEEDGSPKQRLPAWVDVDLEAAGVRPATARPPQMRGGGPAGDTGCLQLDGGLCVTGGCSSAGRVHLWSTANDQLHHHKALQLPARAKGVATLSFERSTNLLVAGCGTGMVQVWDLKSTELLHDLRGHKSDILCHQQSGWRLATGSVDHTVRLWDLRTGEQQHELQLAAVPYSLQVDDWRVAVGCGNGTVQVADLRFASSEGKLTSRAVLPIHTERVWALAMSESHLVSASLDADIVVRSFRPADVEEGLAGGDSAAVCPCFVQIVGDEDDEGSNSEQDDSSDDDMSDSAYDGSDVEEGEAGSGSEDEGSQDSASEEEDDEVA